MDNHKDNPAKILVLKPRHQNYPICLTREEVTHADNCAWNMKVDVLDPTYEQKSQFQVLC